MSALPQVLIIVMKICITIFVRWPARRLLLRNVIKVLLFEFCMGPFGYGTALNAFAAPPSHLWSSEWAFHATKTAPVPSSIYMRSFCNHYPFSRCWTVAFFRSSLDSAGLNIGLFSRRSWSVTRILEWFNADNYILTFPGRRRRRVTIPWDHARNKITLRILLLFFGTPW